MVFTNKHCLNTNDKSHKFYQENKNIGENFAKKMKQMARERENVIKIVRKHISPPNDILYVYLIDAINDIFNVHAIHSVESSLQKLSFDPHIKIHGISAYIIQLKDNKCHIIFKLPHKEQDMKSVVVFASHISYKGQKIEKVEPVSSVPFKDIIENGIVVNTQSDEYKWVMEILHQKDSTI